MVSSNTQSKISRSLLPVYKKSVFVWCFVFFVVGCSQSTPLSFQQSSPGIAENSLIPFPLEPQLKLETGQHLGRINRLGLDVQSRWLVTGSHDKTVRIWDIQHKKLTNTYRPPLGPSQEGEIRAVAISPDGDMIACAGWTGEAWDGTFSVYIFRRVTGAMVGRISSLPSTVQDLAISPDGRLLAVGLYGQNGVRVYRFSDLSPIMTDRGYLPFSSVYGLAFDRNNRLVTASYDGYIRLYDEDLQLVSKRRAPGGRHPYDVAFSPDGEVIAVGYQDSDAVSLLSGDTLEPESEQPEYSPVPHGSFSTVCWSENGAYLYAGGTARGEQGIIVRKWDRKGKGSFLDSFPTDNSILDLAPLDEDKVIYGDANGRWGIVHHESSVFHSRQPILDFRDTHGHLLISSDASMLQVVFPSTFRQTLHFNIPQRVLYVNPKERDLWAPIVQTPKVQVENWQNLSTPTINQEILRLDPNEVSRSFSISPDEQHVIFGSSWALRLVDKKGKIIWKVSVPGDVWAVNISRDGKVAVAALGDGTIRWFRLNDGKELLSLFIFQESKEYQWILWSSSGYYDAAPGGEHLLIWNKNYGPNQAADAFSVSHFRAIRYRPDVIAKVLDTWDEDLAIRLANIHKSRITIPYKLSPIQQNLLNSQFKKLDALTTLKKGNSLSSESENLQLFPPRIIILTPSIPIKSGPTDIRVVFSVWTPKKTPLTSLEAFVNDELISSLRDIPLVGETAEGWPIFELHVPVQETSQFLSIVAAHHNGVSASKEIPIEIETLGVYEGFENKPNLFVVAVGVDQYPDEKMSLPFSVADARWIESICKTLSGPVFANVQTKLLLNEQVSQQSLLRELDWLDRVTTENDVAFIFFSGHSVVNESGYSYFLPSGGDLKHLKQTGLSFSVIGNTLRSIAGRKVVFADVCHQNTPVGVVGCNSALHYLAKDGVSAGENSVVVFSTANQGRTVLGSGWENGALILALQQELKETSKASNIIWAGELQGILRERIRVLTRGYQSPTVLQSSYFEDFPILALGQGKSDAREYKKGQGPTSPVSIPLEKLPPVITIISPDNYQAITSPTVRLQYMIRNPSSEPIIDLKVLFNGKPIPQKRGIQVGLKATSLGTMQEIHLNVPEEDVKITLLAKTQWATSEPATIHLIWSGPASPKETPKPKLFALAVGISQYEDPVLNLEYAAKDAFEFSAFLEQQKGGLYKNVILKRIVDVAATKESILQAFEILEQNTTANDVAIIFLAGHGVNDKGGIYYFLPHQADTSRLRETAIAFSEIQETLSAIKGKTLLFVDTCHAGNIMGVRRGVPDINAFISELTRAENGAIVFAASTGRQYSQESEEWGNGAFTEALLEGLNGKADILNKGAITVNMLRLFLSERVKELTKGKQTPTTISPHTIPDFPFVLVPS